MPRLRAAPVPNRRAIAPPNPAACNAAEAADAQPTMLQRVREHIASLRGFTHTEHELLRWDSIERLEGALRRRER